MADSNWGNLYTQALNAWNALPEDQRTTVNPQTNESSTKFDNQSFFNNLGIWSLDPRFSQYAQGESPDLNAQSYGFANADAMLNHMTGAGQYVDDPTLGKLWVPNNRNSQTWDKNFVGAQNANKGFVNNFMDSGGLVKLLGGAVGGMGFGDLANGGLDSFGNVLRGTAGGVDVPYDVGQNLVNNPSTFDPSPAFGNSGIDPSWGVNPRGNMGDLTNWFDEVGTTDGEMFNNVPASTLNPADYANFPTSLLDILKGGSKLLTGGGASRGGANTGIDWLDNILNSAGSLAGTVSPLVAANYAKNTLGGLDPLNDKIQSIADKYSPEAATMQYDLQTGQGRNALTSSLSDRGVSGSSFGNFDLASFDTLRDVGRQNVLNGGATTSASLYDKVYQNKLNQKKAELGFLGAGLYGAGNGLKQPTNTLLGF